MATTSVGNPQSLLSSRSLSSGKKQAQINPLERYYSIAMNQTVRRWMDEVCKLFSDSKTKEREIEGLMEALEAYDLKEGLILTEDAIDNIVVKNKKIVVLPVWFWLLN